MATAAAALRREDCELAVRSCLKTSDCTLEDYRVRPYSEEKIVGYMGRHLTVIADVRLADGRTKEIHFFAKLIPTSASHRSFVVDSGFFDKEEIAYRTLVPKLRDLLPAGTPSTFPVPECFFTRAGNAAVPGSEGEEIIILEDLTSRGYRTLENDARLDLAHCYEVMRSLAKFHASSILLEESCRKSHPTDFDPERDLFSGVKEKFLIDQEGHMGYEWAKFSAESMVTASFKMWPERFRGVSRDEVMETLMNSWTRVFQFAKTSPEYPNVLCHGDMWTNNIMFSYERDAEGNEVPVDAVFVDLQLVRYAPPILDILLFIHVCTKRDFRERHLEGFLKFYHESLKEYVSVEFLEEFMPFGQLLEMCDRYRDFGRVMGMGFLSVSMGEDEPSAANGCEPREPLDINAAMLKDRGDQIVRNCAKNEECMQRITEIFQECLKGLELWT